MSNGLTFEILNIISQNFYLDYCMLGHDLEMSRAKFQGNRFRIDGEIDKIHALQIILSKARAVTIEARV